jgi:hypothetical protein
MLCPKEGIASSHVMLSTHEQCTIIPDLQRDWRTRNHPLVRSKGAHFMAGALLLYTRHDPPVVFGSLILFDNKARDVFTHREQGLLMRLSNMLVYQLATFVSAGRGGEADGSNRKSWRSARRACMSRAWRF